MAERDKDKDDDVLQEAREEYAAAQDGWSDAKDSAKDDLLFGRLGEQWDSDARAQRKIDGRPCLTINDMPATIRQVVNDGRQNRPSIKVRPANSGADVHTAEIISGLVRHIEQISDADVAYDTGLDNAASMGFGFITVDVDYACDDTFDLEIKINAIPNALSVSWDHKTEAADSSDWRFAFIDELMDEKDFDKAYPGFKYDASDFSADANLQTWYDAGTIRLSRYYKREEIKRKIVLLSDGIVVDRDIYEKQKDVFDATGATVQAEREVMSYEIVRRLITGCDIIDEKRWKGSIIPIVPVYGEQLNVEGKRYFKSLISDAKDAQRMFNLSRSTVTELIGRSPKVPFIGRKGTFDADPDKWATINTQSHSYVEYDGDLPPQRVPFPDVPAGLVQEALAAADDKKRIMGISDPALGIPDSRLISGKAKRMERHESDTSTYHFGDNQQRAIRCVGRICLELIPQVYSGARIARILGLDGKAQNVALGKAGSQPPQGFDRVYDLTAGKYDLVVEAGPSYTTRREESTEMLTSYIQAAPETAAILGPMVVKMSDMPDGEKVTAMLATMMPPAARQIFDGTPPAPPQPPPEVMIAQQKAQADAQLQRESAQLDAQLEQQAANNRIDIEKLQAQADMAVSREKAQMEMQLERERASLKFELMREEAKISAAIKMTTAAHAAANTPQPAPGVQ